MSAFWKPEPRAKRKAREDRQKARQRTACVERVWQRAQGACENPRCCQQCIPPKLAAWPGALNVGHVHEEPFRSKGGDPTNPEECVLVCTLCHDRIHGKRKPRLAVQFEGGAGKRQLWEGDDSDGPWVCGNEPREAA